MENERISTKRKIKDSYHLQYKRMKFTVKQLVYENVALSDEIDRTEDRIVTSKTERKFLLRKLLQYEKPENKQPKSERRTVNNREKTNKTKNDNGETTDIPPGGVGNFQEVKLSSSDEKDILDV